MALLAEDLTLIRQLLDSLPIFDVAKKFDCTVSDIRNALGIRRNSKAEKIRELIAKGKSRSECAKIVGCHPKHVIYAIGAANAPPVISVGMTFSHLTVIDNAEPTKTRIKRYLCLCDCGSRHIARHDCLMSGKTKSCGCKKGKLRCAALDFVNREKRNFNLVRGRPVKVNFADVRQCYKLIKEEGLTVSDAVKSVGIKVSTYYRHLKKAIED